MRTIYQLLILLAALLAIALGITSCGTSAKLTVEQGQGPNPQLPQAPNPLVPVVNVAKAVGWPEGGQPIVAAGFTVSRFAEGLDHPRWMHVLPNGDVLVAESNAQPKETRGFKAWLANRVMKKAGATVKSADRITLLRDADNDGVAEIRSVFLSDLVSPFGMALVGSDLYVANTDAVVRFKYAEGHTRISAAGETLASLPAGPINHHWTKNLVASEDGNTLYVSVGSNSNIGENGLDKEVDRAAILAINRISGATQVFASGLRNPVGMDWNPVTGDLWTVVNERDEIGGDLVPDYLTSVKKNGFYGWPFSYFGAVVDTRVQPQNPELVATAIKPDYALGPHTASLGLAFYSSDAFPARYANGAFVGQHGSWNRKPRSGYKVVFIPFQNGVPEGMPEDILSGFLSASGQAYGRPVGVAVDTHGALLVADDVGNVIWRVSRQ